MGRWRGLGTRNTADSDARSCQRHPQEGYAAGYLLAAVAYFLVFPHLGWRGMFVVGVLPALLVFYIRSQVKESPVWESGQARPIGERGNILRAFSRQPLLFIYAILLMTAFNFMSHGTQDLYPTFLQKQHGFGVGQTSLITIIANIGAIVGGTYFGFLSQRFGRKRSILVAVAFAAVMVPLWVFSPATPLLALGGFLMQFFVQGAWGIIPVHLNELSPGDVRGSFAGLTYQLGNLFSGDFVYVSSTGKILSNRVALGFGIQPMSTVQSAALRHNGQKALYRRLASDQSIRPLSYPPTGGSGGAYIRTYSSQGINAAYGYIVPPCDVSLQPGESGNMYFNAYDSNGNDIVDAGVATGISASTTGNAESISFINPGGGYINTGWTNQNEVYPC
ncbi:MAG TPA: MFS transporter, partial [Candidatus Acidoferrales bacterium]|nr:MFS transporter [Candidatus Acidoferrales bacterium]